MNMLENNHTLTEDEAYGYIRANDNFANKIGYGVTLCILSPVMLICFTGLMPSNFQETFFESAYIGSGIMILLVIVAFAVKIFIVNCVSMNKYGYIKNGEFEIQCEDQNIIGRMYDEFEDILGKGMSKGVFLCIISPIPLILSALIGLNDKMIIITVCALLVIVSIGVNKLVKLSLMRQGYMSILKKEEFHPSNKERTKLADKIGGIYWPSVVAIYLFWSFTEEAWIKSWVIFPIAGLIFAAIVNAVNKVK